MKKLINIVFLLVLTMTMQAQEGYSFPVKFRGKAPSVSDFAKARSQQEDPGELLASIRKNKKRQYGNDYVMYFNRIASDRFVWTDTTEICCWDNSDGRHKIVVMIHRDYSNGKIAAGQYSGLSLSVYDAYTRRMEMASSYDMGIEPPEINGLYIYTLSAKDKTVTISVNSQSEVCESRTYIWNGRNFTIIKP